FKSLLEHIRSLQKLLDRDQNEIIKKMEDIFVGEELDLINEKWYANKLKNIKNQILLTANQIDNQLIVPLFILKGNLKGKAYDDKLNFDFYSTQARIFSLLFSALSK